MIVAAGPAGCSVPASALWRADCRDDQVDPRPVPGFLGPRIRSGVSGGARIGSRVSAGRDGSRVWTRSGDSRGPGLVLGFLGSQVGCRVSGGLGRVLGFLGSRTRPGVSGGVLGFLGGQDQVWSF